MKVFTKTSTLLFASLFFLTCGTAFANQIIHAPSQLGTEMTKDWLLLPSESVTVNNAASIQVIIYSLSRDEAGAPLNGVNVVCNGMTEHVNAGSYKTCQTSGNVTWSNDDISPGVWAQGFVTIGFIG